MKESQQDSLSHEWEGQRKRGVKGKSRVLGLNN